MELVEPEPRTEWIADTGAEPSVPVEENSEPEMELEPHDAGAPRGSGVSLDNTLVVITPASAAATAATAAAHSTPSEGPVIFSDSSFSEDELTD